MEMKLRKLSGEDGHIRVERLEMEDPDFESETRHICHATFRNPKTVPYDYGAELYLGKYQYDKAVSGGIKTFSIIAGGTKKVDLPITMPRLTVPDDTFHFYIECTHLGVELITFIGTEDISVFVIPAIEVTEVTWD